jgi:hypothetical protein
MSGNKKQKMDMAKAIVEAIYSMDPPGRFLKKCPKTRQWIELSRREAADKAAQAMAYAINGESLKEKRREQQRSRLPPSLRPQDGAAEKSSPSVGRTTKDNHLGGVRSSSVARHHGHAALGGSGEADTTNAQSAGSDDDHADADLAATNEMVLPGDSPNLSSQQLSQQLLQSSSTTLPTYSGPSLNVVNAQQNGLVQVFVLAQALRQQQQYQQQLSLQHSLGQDLFGLETLTPLPPASLEGLTQQMSQAQQQQEQQLLFQHLLNQPNVFPSASPPSALSFPAPFLSASSLNDFLRGNGTTSNFSLTGPRSQPANRHLLQTQGHPQSNTSHALLLSVMSNQPNNANVMGPFIAPQQASQLDQVQRSLARQLQKLLASSLSNPTSDNSLLQQQLQSPPLHQWQAALRHQRHSQKTPLPSLNSDAAELLSAKHRTYPPSSRGEKSGKRRR